jgi:hypothetical protein
MSLTSYQAAPPRVLVENQVGSILETRNLISELFQAPRSAIRPTPALTHFERPVAERSLEGIVKKEQL